MATIRAYTTIEQSRKLAEILPLESADYNYSHQKKDVLTSYEIGLVPYNKVKNLVGKFIIDDIQPAWSLAALLDILDYPQLSKDKLGSGKEGWMVSVYPNDCRYDSCWHDNPVDACVDMIEKLHELNLL